ncbi:hypothetical protein EDC94DRAFT_584590 [Helicostylum pulchrum]|nr:hypothetical protein EDC94DRAFT_584590 [Helicostylum pulchrum]
MCATFKRSFLLQYACANRNGSLKSRINTENIKYLRRSIPCRLSIGIIVRLNCYLQIEDMELWRKDCDEKELTYYTRFRSIMEGSGVTLADGCSNSRITIEKNKYGFSGEDTLPSYSRKIDLLLKYYEKKDIHLCSNKWKKAKDLKLKQHFQNSAVSDNTSEKAPAVTMNKILISIFKHLLIMRNTFRPQDMVTFKYSIVPGAGLMVNW